mmetsp:Transcript_1530/g.6026  ORF Transcript_1530/g.6026 Transcript_1530/m.6026 type:complete len:215 (-) Transcript_1530:1744-2388(-)
MARLSASCFSNFAAAARFAASAAAALAGRISFTPEMSARSGTTGGSVSALPSRFASSSQRSAPERAPSHSLWPTETTYQPAFLRMVCLSTVGPLSHCLLLCASRTKCEGPSTSMAMRRRGTATSIEYSSAWCSRTTSFSPMALKSARATACTSFCSALTVGVLPSRPSRHASRARLRSRPWVSRRESTSAPERPDTSTPDATEQPLVDLRPSSS